ncbi:MAG TPA: hypothetical protein VN457_05630, partial [Chlamydiales bacterium]|nr:hypothetical protein [Chlamydiales bacterium]
VKRKTGIDVSVGVAPTKTLAKAANFFAKQKPELQGVMVMDDIERALKEMPVEEVWGIGRKIATRLRRHQIYTAWDLSQQPDDSIRKILSVVGLRMAFELRGTPCLGFHEFREPKKSISTARSFKQREKLIENIEPILASYVEQIAHELRSEKQLASTLTVWIETNPFGKDEYYSQAAAHVFSEPTAFTPEMIRVAKELLQGIFREGFSYKKVGIMVSDLVPQGSFQRDFLKETDDAAFHRQQKLMKLVDEMNETFGKKTLYFGAQM